MREKAFEELVEAAEEVNRLIAEHDAIYEHWVHEADALEDALQEIRTIQAREEEEEREVEKSFIVEVREVHIQPVGIRADTPEKAKEKVADGEGDYDYSSLEYSHTLDPETWTVTEMTQAKIA